MELRKHYLLNQWTYVAESRGARQKEFGNLDLFPEVKHCYFCQGNEEPELHIGQIGKDKNWQIRWIHNKYSAVSLNPPKVMKHNLLFQQKQSIGYQEVIIESPMHNLRFCDLPTNQLIKVFKVYQNRLKTISSMDKVKYTLLFKNFGKSAGASIVHPHSQIIALDTIPEQIIDKVKASKKFNSCPLCQVIREERKSKRFIFENDHFIAFAPFAPRFSFEFWVLPIKHKTDFKDFNDNELSSLAKLIRKIFPKIKSAYNFYFQYSPNRKDNLHFHIEVTPRESIWAGFELGNSRFIVSTSPEDTASYYRSKK